MFDMGCLLPHKKPPSEKGGDIVRGWQMWTKLPDEF
jgi:hypothetical protein